MSLESYRRTFGFNLSNFMMLRGFKTNVQLSKETSFGDGVISSLRNGNYKINDGLISDLSDALMAPHHSFHELDQMEALLQVVKNSAWSLYPRKWFRASSQNCIHGHGFNKLYPYMTNIQPLGMGSNYVCLKCCTLSKWIIPEISSTTVAIFVEE